MSMLRCRSIRLKLRADSRSETSRARAATSAVTAAACATSSARHLAQHDRGKRRRAGHGDDAAQHTKRVNVEASAIAARFICRRGSLPIASATNVVAMMMAEAMGA
jgi:hypothetical protein